MKLVHEGPFPITVFGIMDARASRIAYRPCGADHAVNGACEE